MLYHFGAPHQWGNFTKQEKKTKTNKQKNMPHLWTIIWIKFQAFQIAWNWVWIYKRAYYALRKGSIKNIWSALIGQSQWLAHVVAFNWSHLILSRILGVVVVGDERHIILDVRHPHTMHGWGVSALTYLNLLWLALFWLPSWSLSALCCMCFNSNEAKNSLGNGKVLSLLQSSQGSQFNPQTVV
jgi:hypothetical protein